MSWEATGLCHSDHHVRTGDLPGVPLPVVGGHEGAGIVEEVGSGVRGLEVGDHVVASFLPACGRCRWCATGQQNLCDLGAMILVGLQTDGTYRRRARGQDVGTVAGVGSFSQHGTVSEASVVKVDDDVPLVSRVPAGLRGDDGLGLGSQHRRRQTGRHRRGDRLRWHRQRRDPGRAAGRRGKDRRRRPCGEQAREGFRVRRHPLCDVHARSDRAGGGADARRHGRFRAADGRPARGADDQRCAR